VVIKTDDFLFGTFSTSGISEVISRGSWHPIKVNQCQHGNSNNGVNRNINQLRWDIDLNLGQSSAFPAAMHRNWLRGHVYCATLEAFGLNLAALA
jgi:hypothetical protein